MSVQYAYNDVANAATVNPRFVCVKRVCVGKVVLAPEGLPG